MMNINAVKAVVCDPTAMNNAKRTHSTYIYIRFLWDHIYSWLYETYYSFCSQLSAADFANEVWMLLSRICPIYSLVVILAPCDYNNNNNNQKYLLKNKLVGFRINNVIFPVYPSNALSALKSLFSDRPQGVGE